MQYNFFEGFRKLIENEEAKLLVPRGQNSPKKGSGLSGIDPKMATLNATGDDLMKTMVVLTVPPQKELKSVDGSISKVAYIRQFRVKSMGKHIATIIDVTGKCDDQGKNITRNQAATCSPTDGQYFTVTREHLDELMLPQPAGQGPGGPGGALGI